MVQQRVHCKRKYSSGWKVTKLCLIKSVALYHSIFINTSVNMNSTGVNIFEFRKILLRHNINRSDQCMRERNISPWFPYWLKTYIQCISSKFLIKFQHFWVAHALLDEFWLKVYLSSWIKEVPQWQGRICQVAVPCSHVQKFLFLFSVVSAMQGL